MSDKEAAPQVLEHPEARTTESLEATVIERSLAQPTTRHERGIALGIERFDEITRVAPWIWSVPSCSRPGVHVVNLKTSECSCPDRTPEGEEDKHVVAARYVKAKTASCIGCGGRFRHRDLFDVGEDSLTFFEGDILCGGCARDHGVL